MFLAMSFHHLKLLNIHPSASLPLYINNQEEGGLCQVVFFPSGTGMNHDGRRAF